MRIVSINRQKTPHLIYSFEQSEQPPSDSFEQLENHLIKSFKQPEHI